jgi:hypothetical protein
MLQSPLFVIPHAKRVGTCHLLLVAGHEQRNPGPDTRFARADDNTERLQNRK